MLDWLWILTVIPALGFLVFVHELGHFLTALRMGIKVEEFGFGYPPRMVTLFHWKGVPVTLNWLPLGGFVRMAGEEGNFDAEGSLAAAPPWKKIPVMAAGAFMNLLAAIVILGGLSMYEPLGQIRVSNVGPNSPAAAADLRQNDIILEVEDQPVDSTRNLQALIRSRNGQPTEIDIQRQDPQRGSVTFPVTVTPENNVIGVSIGVPSELATGSRVNWNPITALLNGVRDTFTLTFQLIGVFGSLIGSLFGLSEANIEGGLAGPVGIGRIYGEVAQSGLAQYLHLTALISVNLAVFNLLPIPALDGSRIVFALIEWIRRGKRVPPEKEAMVHALGMVTLLALMVLVTLSDVRNAVMGLDPFGQ